MSRDSKILSLLVVVLILINGFLLIREGKLSKRVAFLSRLEGPVAGMLASDISGNTPDGAPVHVSFRDTQRHPKTLLLVFSPRCGVCGKNWPQWGDLAAAAKAKGVRVMYIDLSSSLAPDYLSAHGLNSVRNGIVTELSSQTVINYRFSATPQTILISETGTVSRVWTGLLQASTVSAIVGRL